MMLKLIKRRNRSEFIQELKDKYGSMENLQRLIKKTLTTCYTPLIMTIGCTIWNIQMRLSKPRMLYS